MKHTFIACFLIAGMIISCNSEKKSDTKTEVLKSAKACFEYFANNDTATMSLDFVDNKVTGFLTYNLYEKDKSQGTLLGEMRGDTLIAEYTFQAEGVMSINEVVFLKHNNQLIQGFGETVNSEGKQVFKNRSTLDFNDSLVLAAVECEKK